MKTKIRIGWGVAVFALFILLGGYRIIDLSVALPWIFAVFLHEMGHFLVAKIRCAGISCLTLDVTGAKMTLCGRLLSYKDEILIAVAGPLVNIITFAVTFGFLEEFSAFSLMLGLLNLFPISGFDGYRILFSVIALRGGEEKADFVMKMISFCAIISLWLISVYLLLRFGAGFSAFILSCSLFSSLLV